MNPFVKKYNLSYLLVLIILLSISCQKGEQPMPHVEDEIIASEEVIQSFLRTGSVVVDTVDFDSAEDGPVTSGSLSDIIGGDDNEDDDDTSNGGDGGDDGVSVSPIGGGLIDDGAGEKDPSVEGDDEPILNSGGN